MKKFLSIILSVLVILNISNGFAIKKDIKLNIPDEKFQEEKINYKKNKIESKTSLVSLKTSDESREINDRRIIIQFKDNIDVDSIINYMGCIVEAVTERLDKRNIRVVKVPEEIDFDKKLRKIRENSVVKYAEPDYIVKSDYIRKDFYYSEQWYLDKINIENAWDINRNSDDVVVAVLDTGVDYNHIELKGRVLEGIDLVNNDKDAMDDNGHGTHVAGIVAANSNYIGINGITQKTKILPIKILDSEGYTTSTVTIDGIYYAIENNVDIINMSLGGSASNSIEEKAILDAYNEGIVLVASAGNENTNELAYPAAYTQVISVAATDENDDKADFSNWGEWIDIAAPGVNILSTAPYILDEDNLSDGYMYMSGTSMATPIISGVCALIKAQHPNWTPQQIEWAIEKSSVQKDNTDRWNLLKGYGRVDAFRALQTLELDVTNDVGNNMNFAKQMISQIEISEKIDLPMDDDWYKFDVTENSRVQVKLSGIDKHMDLVMSLKKSDEGVLKDRLDMDKGFEGEDEEITFYAESGTYYLAVYDYNGHWSEKPYQIQVFITPENTDIMKIQYRNKITLDIKLKEDVEMESVEILDGQNIIGKTSDVVGSIANIEYIGDLDKSKYKVRIRSKDGRIGTKEINILSSLEIIDKDDKNKEMKIRALINGKFYKNGKFIKNVNKDEEIEIKDIQSGDTFEII